jgi:hypothetical protein
MMHAAAKVANQVAAIAGNAAKTVAGKVFTKANRTAKRKANEAANKVVEAAKAAINKTSPNAPLTVLKKNAIHAANKTAKNEVHKKV